MSCVNTSCELYRTPLSLSLSLSFTASLQLYHTHRMFTSPHMCDLYHDIKCMYIPLIDQWLLLLKLIQELYQSIYIVHISIEIDVHVCICSSAQFSAIQKSPPPDYGCHCGLYMTVYHLWHGRDIK